MKNYKFYSYTTSFMYEYFELGLLFFFLNDKCKAKKNFQLCSHISGWWTSHKTPVGGANVHQNIRRRRGIR